MASPFRIRRKWRARRYHPRVAPISVVEIGATYNTLQTALSWLVSDRSDIAPHYVIGKSGSIYELIDPSNRPNGRNDGAVFIELENIAGDDGWTVKQTLSTAWIIRRLNKKQAVKEIRVDPLMNWKPDRLLEYVENDSEFRLARYAIYGSRAPVIKKKTGLRHRLFHRSK